MHHMYTQPHPNTPTSFLYVGVKPGVVKTNTSLVKLIFGSEGKHGMFYSNGPFEEINNTYIIVVWGLGNPDTPMSFKTLKQILIINCP